MIAGVCAGLARYFDVDPALVRLIMVLLAFAHGIGFLFYIVAWLVMPLEPRHKSSGSQVVVEEEEEQELTEDQRVIGRDWSSNSRFWAGVILVVLGIIFLLDNYIAWLTWDVLWPLILIAVGIYLIASGGEKNE